MDAIVVLDFGGQYSHLIARRVRELGVYAEIKDPTVSPEKLKEIEDLKGIILSGGAASVYNESSPTCDEQVIGLGYPVLGICYGHQLIASLTGGEVTTAESGEYGTTELEVKPDSELFRGWEGKEVWMNHKDRVVSMPQSFSVITTSANSPVAAFASEERESYGVQFHPEVTRMEQSSKVLENSVVNICGANQEWDPSHLAVDLVKEAKEEAIDRIRGKLDLSSLKYQSVEGMEQAIGLPPEDLSEYCWTGED